MGGSVTLGGIRTETRIDGRDTRIDVTVDQPAPVAIYNEAEESMQVTLPAAGFQVDALATDGRLSVPEGMLEVKTTDNEQRASGAIGGGGPTITLRSSRGNITIKTKAPAVAEVALSVRPACELPALSLAVRASTSKLLAFPRSPTFPTSDFTLQTSDFLL